MLKFLIVIGSLTISTIASSQIRSPNAIFNDADALFAQRENNIQAVTSARSKYLEHSNSSGRSNEENEEKSDPINMRRIS